MENELEKAKQIRQHTIAVIYIWHDGGLDQGGRIGERIGIEKYFMSKVVRHYVGRIQGRNTGWDHEWCFVLKNTL